MCREVKLKLWIVMHDYGDGHYLLPIESAGRPDDDYVVNAMRWCLVNKEAWSVEEASKVEHEDLELHGPFWPWDAPTARSRP